MTPTLSSLRGLGSGVIVKEAVEADTAGMGAEAEGERGGVMARRGGGGVAEARRMRGPLHTQNY